MQIYEHDTPEAISFKNNCVELESWISHLRYIEKEISNLMNLGNTEFSTAMKYQSILVKLSQKLDENRTKLNALLRYKDSLPQVAECEDVDCDMFYVNEHEKFRKVYMYHLEKYRRVKEEYFNILLK